MDDEKPPIEEPLVADGAAPAAPSAGRLTAEELAEAKRYGRIDLVCRLADKALDLVYLAVAAFWLAEPIDRFLAGWSLLMRFDSLRLLGLLAALTLLHVAVSFPLSFYAGHVVERRFALSTLRFAGWLWRYVKRNVLAFALSAALAIGLFWLIRAVGPGWYLAAAAAMFVINVILGQWAPVVILPLFYKVRRLDDPELARCIGRLAEGTGLRIEGVYRIDLSAETVKANAMLAGLGRTRRVLLGDTLLNGFSAGEIAVVFAHEIGHHVFRHVPKLIVFGAVYAMGGFWLCDWLLAARLSGGVGPVDYAELPTTVIPFLVFILALFATCVEPIQNFLSRVYERQSDRYALRRTGDPAAFISAFEKLARLNKEDPDPHWLEVALLHSHPPIAERIALARRAAARAARAT